MFRGTLTSVSFLQNVTFDSRKQSDSVNYELTSVNLSISDTAILDGQQRLTSLFFIIIWNFIYSPKLCSQKVWRTFYIKFTYRIK